MIARIRPFLRDEIVDRARVLRRAVEAALAAGRP